MLSTSAVAVRQTILVPGLSVNCPPPGVVLRGLGMIASRAVIESVAEERNDCAAVRQGRQQMLRAAIAERIHDDAGGFI